LKQIDMKKVTIITLIVLAAITITFSLTGCYYDSEEELYGTDCDTSNVTYSTTIKGLLNTYTCLTCHIGSNPSGGFTLDTYAGIKARVTDGRLWGAINHLSGFSPMPQGYVKMSDCDIKKVKAWIDAGAPNN
jgi:hypothetical protein